MNFKIRIQTGLYAENQNSNKILPFIQDYPEMGCFNHETVKSYFHSITNEIKVDNSIDDWTLTICICIGGAMDEKEIAMYKRGITYLNDKEKEVSIRISLPSSNEINWGIKKKYRFNQYAKRTIDKGFTIIPVDYSQFDNMKDYIEYSIKVALNRTFTDGITLKGQKIKI